MPRFLLRGIILLLLRVAVSFAQTDIPLTFGEQKTLVVLVNTTEFDRAQWALFSTAPESLDTFYREASQDRVWFTGNIYVVSVQLPSTCDPPAAAFVADVELARQGISLEGYARRIYDVPGLQCPWIGISSWGPRSTTPGGTLYSSIWMRGIGAWHHEMGHSFGLQHAGTWQPYFNRGDNSDVMGAATRLLHAVNREELGWLQPSEIQIVNTTGVYNISPLEERSSTVKVLKLWKADTAQFYYLSYRQPIWKYTNIYSQDQPGAHIHIWRHVPFNDDTQWPLAPEDWTPRVVDTTPETSGVFSDSALSDGRFYYDATNRIKITQLSHIPGYGGHVTLDIEFNGPAPPPLPPPPPPPCKPRGKKGCRV